MGRGWNATRALFIGIDVMIRLDAMTAVNFARLPGKALVRAGATTMARSLAELLPIAPDYGHDGLTAAACVDNPGAQYVREWNGFVRTGAREDPGDGTLITWAIDPANDGRTA